VPPEFCTFGFCGKVWAIWISYFVWFDFYCRQTKLLIILFFFRCLILPVLLCFLVFLSYLFCHFPSIYVFGAICKTYCIYKTVYLLKLELLRLKARHHKWKHKSNSLTPKCTSCAMQIFFHQYFFHLCDITVQSLVIQLCFKEIINRKTLFSLLQKIARG